MRGLMMDYQLTVPAILRRTETLFSTREISSRMIDGSTVRYTYGECLVRARQLGAALQNLGLAPGTRVATLCWNHHQHLECYFGIPSSGLVLHTLNVRLPADDLDYIILDAQDQVLIIDHDLLPLLDRVRSAMPPHIIVVNHHGKTPGYLDYEEFLQTVTDPGDLGAALHEETAASMCYTSGTTGRPKGVLYSHRALVLHSLTSALPDVFSLGEHDIVLPAIPMFHANAWGLPYTAALVGAGLVLTRNALDPTSLIRLLTEEHVTFSAGVPTVWIGVLAQLETHRPPIDLSALKTIVVGGGACPPSLVQAFEERHQLKIVTSWGMTEMTPVGTIGRVRPGGANGERYADRARPGQPVPFVEMRIRREDGLAPWDGTSIGELEVKGPCIAGSYFGDVANEAFTGDGWFRTGDIVSIDQAGTLEVRDRAKDLIKSGGEWISSVALENSLLDHPAVAEAAVIAVPDAKWQERPLAIVVRTAGSETTEETLLQHLGEHFPTWYLPDRIVFANSIPRTGTGKIRKNKLRETYNK